MRRLGLRATTVVALLLGGACYEDDATTAPSGRTGTRALVLLTDAPFPYDSMASVTVFVVRIEASEDPDTSGGGQWAVIAEPRTAFDLLQLQQGTTALLGEGHLTGSLYRAVRMVIDADRSSVRWNDGSQARVRWPAPGSGLIALYALVEEPLFLAADQDSVEIVIDWDVGLSFLYDYYGTGEFTVTPWLRAVHAAFTGAVAGTVTSDYTGETRPLANANVGVYSGDPSRSRATWWLVATGRTDDQGRYRVAFVGSGIYIVRVEQPAYPFLAPVVRSNVEVTNGQTTDVSVSLPEAGAGGAYIRVSGPTSVGVGGTITLFAAVGDANGDPIPNPAITWTSSDTAIATVSGVGDTASVLGRQQGFATITATSNGMSDSLTVQVVGEPQPVAAVSVIPSVATMAVGDSGGFRAELRDAAGNLLTNRPVSWFSTDTTVLTIMGTFGEHVTVRAAGAGAAKVRATSEGKVGEASVTVNP